MINVINIMQVLKANAYIFIKGKGNAGLDEGNVTVLFGANIVV